jgi:ATP-dependent Lhr-like helicase
VSGFEQLHPALQYHIVNSLGWKSLRPFQDDVIPEVLSGKHMVILAPTAGGKTEAAFFPAASRVLSEQWQGLSILYVCPLKALLNNLDLRLQHYGRLLGLKSAVWHGDVSSSERKQILRDHPSCLLTTPESLEVMLLSDLVDHRSLFANLRIVIVDEIHAFAGDDRGWHLLSVLSRITRFAGRELQRVGLSATVGNPQELCEWLAGCCAGPRGVYAPSIPSTSEARVSIDYVGSLQNAAIVISRLHRGEKRLVFIDSRSHVEELGSALKDLGIRTFVTHSSLSQEQRKAAEEAFATGSDCVIVATSVLELGIDVGDLDRVIQIDSPGSVAGFLQRMGRTGRRPGALRNCLFLTTAPEKLLLVSGLVRLWEQGFVESVTPPQQPLHILAQQIMALALQQRGVTRAAIPEWLNRVPPFVAIAPELLESLLAWMLEKDLMWEDNGVLWFGRQGEKDYGRKNFLELFTVFLVPPVFQVMHGRNHVGSIDEVILLEKPQGPRMLLLGGMSWLVNHIDWKRRMIHVEPVKGKGKAKWMGSGRPITAVLARAIRSIIDSDRQMPQWSQRATDQIAVTRVENAWVQEGKTTLISRGGVQWYNFAGTLANMAIANALRKALGDGVRADGLSLTFEGFVTAAQVNDAIAVVRQTEPELLVPMIDENAICGLKFSDCLSPELAKDLLAARYADPEGVQHCLLEPVVTIAESGIIQRGHVEDLMQDETDAAEQHT